MKAFNRQNKRLARASLLFLFIDRLKDNNLKFYFEE